jgi:hypothetical protein
MTITQKWIDARVAQAKREIESDMASGPVPSTVDTFSGLHDYVDANEYGGLCDDAVRATFPNPSSWVAWLDACNAVQNTVDAWLRGRDQKLYIDGKHIEGATGFGFDGCHKIYLVTTAAGHEQLESMGYDIHPIAELPDAWEASCFLRFISPAELNAPDYVSQDQADAHIEIV